MPVITVSRESGSGGGQIAQVLARSLGYHLVEDAIIRSLLQQYGVLSFDDVYDAAPGLSARLVSQRRAVTEMLNRILIAVARHGAAVIVGRGGYAALRGVADVLNVRVQAPLAVRARRILERGDAKDLEEAQDHAKESDRRRATFLELSYGVRWDSTREFDLVLDTAKLPVVTAVALIATAAREMVSPEGGPHPAEAVEVDPVLAEAVTAALGCRALHRITTEEATPPAPA